MVLGNMEKKHQISEVKTDVRLLLECLKCQVDNPSAMKQAFRTLANIFNNIGTDEIKDYFRDLGGLDFITTFNKTVTNVEVKEAAIFCLGCAVENNIYSQKELTTIAQFMNLHKTLSDEKSTTRLKHASSYLLLTLVSNNSLGQSLAKKSLCLSDLLSLLRTSLPSVGKTDCWFDDAGTTGLELWSSVAAALCMCVNNPQNEENQRVCGFVLPYVFTVIQQHDSDVIRPLLSFIRFTVANNGHYTCQGYSIQVKVITHVKDISQVNVITQVEVISHVKDIPQVKVIPQVMDILQVEVITHVNVITHVRNISQVNVITQVKVISHVKYIPQVKDIPQVKIITHANVITHVRDIPQVKVITHVRDIPQVKVITHVRDIPQVKVITHVRDIPQVNVITHVRDIPQVKVITHVRDIPLVKVILHVEDISQVTDIPYTNQKQVKRCGGLNVLSDKLDQCIGKPIDRLSIQFINTIDACITDNVENAEEIGQLETVKTMVKLLDTDKISQDEKLQIVVTLVHAVEMSGTVHISILLHSNITVLQDY
ncbi:Telomere repeats-binding bouquet formation protein 1 [Mytilus edulis]|uniref:Telomere repeats-binding bouquet formation protein 1 n=1 Tax=Mytilus edulis TaxID=6550 RepID=A0A8S3RTZ9_MYTED|nr:Telomere repeats-binding bouquet formation protein 1 [Mytilus edulis]